MDLPEAKEALSFHSGRNDNIENPKWKNGFLASLRPYKGVLNESNFHVIIECFRVIQKESTTTSIERDIVSDVMAILHFGRLWGIHPDGMLRRNGLIKSEDVDQLEDWLSVISYTFMSITETNDEENAFIEYRDYIDGDCQ